MSQWSAKFVIYENHVNKHIEIHRNGCNQIGKNGGTGEGKYIGFTSFEDANEYAETMKLPVRICSFCKEK